MITREVCGQRLKAARKIRGMTQAKLASDAKISKWIIAHIEIGTRCPSIETLWKLADALEVSTDYLIGRCGNPIGHPTTELDYKVSQSSKDTRKIIAAIIDLEG